MGRYSFGSICLGALLIAIVQMLQFLCEQAEAAAREDGNVVGMILAGCLSCFMDILEWLVQIFNKYTMAPCSRLRMSTASEFSSGSVVVEQSCYHYLKCVFWKAIVSIYHMSFENSGYEACSLIYENGMQAPQLPVRALTFFFLLF